MKHTVTFGVIAFNEQKYLPELLLDLRKQSYAHCLIEVVLVDGESTDSTLEIMQAFKSENENEFKAIKILNNPKRIQPAGWNVVIKNASCDILLRIDAHARIPEDFIEQNIKCIDSGEDVCGGPRENIIDEDTPWKKMLLSAEQSMFGAGIASYRKGVNEKKYVKSLFHGCYKREVVNKVGFFNEELIRTEDNEYHYRICKAGYKLCYVPSIKSYYQTRNTLKGILRQKYLNGLWIGRTLFRCPGCISIFHMIPCGFVCGLLLSMVLLAAGITLPFAVIFLSYSLLNILMTTISIIRMTSFNIFNLLLPIVFVLLHLSYGIGTIVGIIFR